MGTDFCDDFCIDIDYEDKEICVITKDNGNFYCKYLVIAIGKNVKNNKYPKQTSYCATCDGYFYKNKVVAIKGNDNKTFEDAEYLSRICEKVYILTDNQPFEFESQNIVDKKIKKYDFDNEKNIIFEDGSILRVDGFFVCDTMSINNISSIGIMVKDNHIKVDENYMTNIKNIFAIGDIIGYPYQVAKCVYDGMCCGMYLSKLGK